jgi:hypothetical protein
VGAKIVNHSIMYRGLKLLLFLFILIKFLYNIYYKMRRNINLSLIRVGFLTSILLPMTMSILKTYRDAYNRGAPMPLLSYCADPSYTKQADGLCYPPCDAAHPTDYGTRSCYGLCWDRYTDTGGPTCTIAATNSYH